LTSEAYTSPSKRDDFLQGVKDILPMVVAYAPIALLWGAISASKGLDPLQALAMSAWGYSGASQFVAMDLWAQPLPMITLIAALLVVNLRHVLMSASISRHMRHMRGTVVGALMFWLTDEAWAMLERRALVRELNASYYLGVAVPIWPTWFGCAFLGNLLGAQFGDGKFIGLDFAFSAMFIAVLAGFWKGPRTGLVLVASAAAAVVAKLYLPGTWYIMAGAIAGMLVAVWQGEEKPA
jgi:4-azaleucine resistance transporter AzlC